MSENGIRLPGLRNWGDVYAIVLLLALIVSIVAWGLKLEADVRYMRADTEQKFSTLRQRAAKLESNIAAGVLPRADERLKRLEEKIQRVESKVDRYHDK